MDATGRGEFAVGFGDDRDPRVAAAFAFLADSSIQEARNALDAVRSGIVKPIDDVICECKDIFGNCISCIEGSIDLGIYDVQEKLDNVRNKILHSVDKSIDRAGGHLVNLYRAYGDPSPPEDIVRDTDTPIDNPHIGEVIGNMRQAGIAYRDLLNNPRDNYNPIPTQPVVMASTMPTANNDRNLIDILTPPGDNTGLPGGNHSIDLGTGSGDTSCTPGKTVEIFNAPDSDGITWDMSGGVYFNDKKTGQSFHLDSGQMADWLLKVGPPCNDPSLWKRSGPDQNKIICTPGCPDSTTLDSPIDTGEGDDSSGSDCCCCKQPPAYPPPDPIDPDPPADGGTDEECQGTPTKLYGIDKDIQGSLSVGSGDATLIYNDDGTVNVVTPWGLKAGLLQSQIGMPLSIGSHKWENAPIILPNGKSGTVYLDSSTGQQIISPVDIDISKLQIGEQGQKCEPSTKQTDPLDAGFWGDYCSVDELPRFRSVFQNSSGNKISTFTDQVTYLMDYAGDFSKPKTMGLGILGESIVKALYKAIIFLISMPFGIVISLFAMVPKPPSCQSAAFGSLWVLHGLSSFAGRWLGLIPEAIQGYLGYLLNYSCQWKLPVQQEANSMYLRDRITKDEWMDATRFNASCPEWQEKLIDATRPQPSLSQAWGLYEAEIITSDEFQTLAKRTGIDIDDQLTHWSYLVQQLPGPADLIRLMTRDAFDDEVVETNKYAEDFDRKFTGKLKEWASRQNIPKEVFERLWYAHWELPSPTQLFEMLHRLRPEKQLTSDSGEPLAVTYEDILEALKTNDMAPAWVEKLTAISYLKPNTMQIQRMYETNTWDTERCIEGYQDAGYTEKDAKDLAKYLTISSAKNRANFLGMVSPDMAQKAFIDGSANEQQYLQALIDNNIDMNIAQSIVHTAKIKAGIADIKTRLQALRKWYLTGGGSDEEYRQRLVATGADQTRISQIVSRDRDVKAAKFKPIQMAKMCKLVGQGYMSIDEYMNRARNLGYTATDASMMVSSCVQEINEHKAKLLEQQQRKAIADAEKADRRAEKERKKQDRLNSAQWPCKRPAKRNCQPGEPPPPVVV